MSLCLISQVTLGISKLSIYTCVCKCLSINEHADTVEHVDEQILRRAIVDQAETRRELVSVNTIHWVYVYVDLQTGFLKVPGIDIEGYFGRKS